MRQGRVIICGGWRSRTGGDRGVGVVGGDGGGYIRQRVVCQVEYEELLFSLALEKNQESRPWNQKRRVRCTAAAGRELSLARASHPGQMASISYFT